MYSAFYLKGSAHNSLFACKSRTPSAFGGFPPFGKGGTMGGYQVLSNSVNSFVCSFCSESRGENFKLCEPPILKCIWILFPQFDCTLLVRWSSSHFKFA